MNKTLSSTAGFIAKNHLFIVFFITFLGLIGSLFFSEVELLQPCVLCWYQRIPMYALAILSFVAAVRKDNNFTSYILALSIPGMIIGAYHYLIQKTIIGESLPEVCTGGVSCTKVDFELLGFITIPLLSFLAFLTIVIVAVITRKVNKKV